jgi:hypothetical protein
MWRWFVLESSCGSPRSLPPARGTLAIKVVREAVERCLAEEHDAEVDRLTVYVSDRNERWCLYDAGPGPGRRAAAGRWSHAESRARRPPARRSGCTRRRRRRVARSAHPERTSGERPRFSSSSEAIRLRRTASSRRSPIDRSALRRRSSGRAVSLRRIQLCTASLSGMSRSYRRRRVRCGERSAQAQLRGGRRRP